MNRRIAARFLCLTACLCLACCGCGRETPPVTDAESVYWEFAQLSDVGKGLYHEITEAAGQGETQFHFKDCPSEEIDAAFHAVLQDHPEWFWLGDGYTLRTVTDAAGTAYTLDAVAAETADLERQRADLEAVVNDVVSQAETKATAYEKLLLIHDYIIDRTRYDQETYQLISSGDADREVFASSTAYGCLVNGTAVCSGYATAFQLLAQRLGFLCGRVSGFKTGGESHEWNFIRADGDFYFVDVTWDDPVSQDGDADLKSYEYFCIDDGELALTHTVTPGQHVPACGGSALNYYRHNGLYMEQYAFDDVKRIFEKTGESGCLELKFGTKSEREKAQADLIEQGKVFDLDPALQAQGSISYAQGDSGLLLTIRF